MICHIQPQALSGNGLWDSSRRDLAVGGEIRGIGGTLVRPGMRHVLADVPVHDEVKRFVEYDSQVDYRYNGCTPLLNFGSDFEIWFR